MSPCDLGDCINDRTGYEKHCCRFCELLQLSADPTKFTDASNQGSTIDKTAQQLAELQLNGGRAQDLVPKEYGGDETNLKWVDKFEQYMIEYLQGGSNNFPSL